MAKNPKTVPASYPQPLGAHMLRADAQRLMSMMRQEIVTELLSLLADTHEAAVRQRVIRLIEGQLRSGLTALHRAKSLWPDLQEAKEAIDVPEGKPALQKRHLQLYAQFDRVQQRSWGLLHDSFENIRLILDRVQRPERVGGETNKAALEKP
jgi:hypothetical protein